MPVSSFHNHQIQSVKYLKCNPRRSLLSNVRQPCPALLGVQSTIFRREPALSFMARDPVPLSFAVSQPNIQRDPTPCFAVYVTPLDLLLPRLPPPVQRTSTRQPDSSFEALLSLSPSHICFCYLVASSHSESMASAGKEWRQLQWRT
jgi:hypothetical protein